MLKGYDMQKRKKEWGLVIDTCNSIQKEIQGQSGYKVRSCPCSPQKERNLKSKRKKKKKIKLFPCKNDLIIYVKR